MLHHHQYDSVLPCDSSSPVSSSRSSGGSSSKVKCRRSSWPPCTSPPDPHCDTQIHVAGGPGAYRIQSDCVSEVSIVVVCTIQLWIIDAEYRLIDVT